MPLSTELTHDLQLRTTWPWKLFQLLDYVVSPFGIRLPLKMASWFAARSVQAKIDGRWQNVPLTAAEVHQDAFG